MYDAIQYYYLSHTKPHPQVHKLKDHTESLCKSLTCSTALVGLGLLIVEVSTRQLYTAHSVGLFCTSDRPVPETATFTTHKIHKRQTSMLPAGFEPAIAASYVPQTHALRAATKIGELTQLTPYGAHSPSSCSS